MMRSNAQYYVGGILMGLAVGWMFASLLQRHFVMVEKNVTAETWSNTSVIVCTVLLLTGSFIVSRARGRKGTDSDSGQAR